MKIAEAMFNKAFIIDTETTGLVHNRTIKLDKLPEIIEFYGCLVNLDTGDTEAELELMFRPRKKIKDLFLPKGEKTITEITGITDEMLMDKAPFEYHADQIQKALEAGPVIIGHNLSFDVEMFDLEFERVGKKLKWPHLICTVEQTIHLKGHRLTQSALHELLFGEGFKDAHRAKPDVLALKRCVVELRDRGWI